MPTDVTESTFERDVLQASHERPILVDFWAPWCGPCRVVGPVLEKLESQAQGRWTLVKINTDENPNLALRYRIQGIPAMKLFQGAEVIGELTGALPERQLQVWLDEQIPSEAKKLLAAALEARKAGDLDTATTTVDRALEMEPERLEALVLKAELLLPTDPEAAASLLINAPEMTEQHDRIDAVRCLAELWHRHEPLAQSKTAQRYQEGIEALREARYADACEAWIDVVRLDRKLDDDGARRACVALFNWLGEEHLVTRNHRSAFASALF